MIHIFECNPFPQLIIARVTNDTLKNKKTKKIPILRNNPALTKGRLYKRREKATQSISIIVHA